MATKVDELIVQIKADTKDLNRKLGQLEGQVKKAGSGKAMGGLRSSLAALRGPAMAAAAAIGGIALASAPIVNVGRKFEDLKISLNTVFGSITAGSAAFDQIREFATESPFQVADLSKAFIQLKSAGIEPTKEMFDRFSDAASVTTDSLGAFEALVRITQRSVGGGLGLEELEQLAGRGIPVYEILAEKLGVTRQEISDMGQEAEGAAKIMDALGIGLEERFGGTTAAKMETVNQKISNLSDSFDGLALAFFEEGGVGAGVKTLLDNLISAVDEAAILAKVLSTGLPREFFEAGGLEERIAVLRKTIADRDARGSPNKHGAMAFERNTDKLREELALLEEELRLSKEQAKAAADKAKATKQNTEQKRQEVVAAQALNDEMEELRKIVDSTIPDTEILSAQIQRLQEILDTGDQSLIEKAFGDRNTVETMRLLKEQLQEMQDPVAETAELFDEALVTAIVNTSHAFTNEFVNALLEGQSALDSFKNFARNVVSQIIATFLQLAVVNKILNAVFSNFSGYTPLPTMSFGGTGGSNISSGMGTGLTYASGGSFGAGRPMLVGERGPELIIPNSGGRVMNAHSTRLGGGGGIVINQSLNFSTGVVPTVRQEIFKMLPTISDVTKASVLEAASRGGTYRKGLLGT